MYINFIPLLSQYMFPAVRAIPKVIELRSFSSPVPLMQPSDVVIAVHALVTFTTGSTGTNINYNYTKNYNYYNCIHFFTLSYMLLLSHS